LLGYAGTILYVDLTTGKTRTEKLSDDVAKKYVGGIGLGMKLYLSNSKAGVDPLSAENPLVLSVGPVSGTMFPTGGNGHAFISKSPETNGVGEAVSHGTFGAELKRAGYDAVIFTGKAEKPVYLWIDDESAQILDASQIWGKSPGETEDAIKNEIGDYYVRVASIGLAGENLSKISKHIQRENPCGRQNRPWRSYGQQKPQSHRCPRNPRHSCCETRRIHAMVKEFHERMKGPAAQKYRTLGTSENIMIQNALSCLPTRNFNNAHFENAEKVSAETLNERYIAKIIACNSCAMRCEHEAVIKEGPYKGTLARMEYDNVWAL
jgi:aldehyde:ferredoxin oxidoreductase